MLLTFRLQEVGTDPMLSRGRDGRSNPLATSLSTNNEARLYCRLEYFS
jgi:hypothetical protein